jgi:hypothetical protein
MNIDEKGPDMDGWGAPHVDMWRPREVANREYMQCIMPAGRDSCRRKREGFLMAWEITHALGDLLFYEGWILTA